MQTPRALLIGKEQTVLDGLLRALRADGHAVEGTIKPTTAAHQFDARDFTLIGLGGGLNDQQRQLLRQAFQQQNPAIRVEDVFGPVGREQLAFLLRTGAQQPVLEELTVSVVTTPMEVQVVVRDPIAATLTWYYQQPQLHQQVLWKGVLPAGMTRLPLIHMPPLLPNTVCHLVLHLVGGELHTYRFTIPT